MTAQVKIGSETFNLSPNRSVNVNDIPAASIAFRDGDGYMTTTYQTLSAGSLNVSIYKEGLITSEGPVTTVDESKKQERVTYTYEQSNSVHFDNFHLEYRGTQTVAIDPNADYKKIVREKVNETYLEVIKLNAAGQAAYDITVVINRYNNDQITSGAIAETMCGLVDKAYANAYAAHMAYIVQQAVDQMEQNGGDITGAIVNSSFETGDLTGWTVGEGVWDLGAKSTTDDVYASEGSDGNYLFNAYSGEHGHTTSVMQTIKGIPNGLYELKAMMTSHGATEAVDVNNPKTQANRVYLVGNSYHTSIAAERNNKFEEGTLYFLVEDGTAVIGAIGGNKGGGGPD